MATHKKNEFDCIELKRKAQAEIYQAISQMTPREEIAYFQQSIKDSKLSEWWKTVSSRVELSEIH